MVTKTNAASLALVIGSEATGTGDNAAGTDTNTNTNAAPIVGAVVDIMAQFRTAKDTASEMKVTTMQVVRQRLAQAADLFKAGGDKAAEATVIADGATGLLYQARADGRIDANEVSAVLGDIFGYVPKKDKTPGKTPAGQGGAIRKRVFRAIEARQYVAGEDGGRFFDGLPVDEVSAIVDRMELEDAAERLSIYSAYDLFTKLKTSHNTPSNPAFDPKKIAAIAGSLGVEGAAELWRSSPELIKAYVALVDIIDVLRMVPVEVEAV